jgi:hypothetical protein
VKKRFITSLAAGTLMAAMLPGVAAAQTEGEGTTTYIANFTCEFGQGSPLSLPPCEVDEEGLVTVTMLNQGTTTGALEGMQVLDAVAELNLADGSFSGSGSLYWTGTVEGCGAGTYVAEAEFAGAPGADGITNFSVNNYTIVPGGSLPITGTWDGTGAEVPNPDGSATQTTTTTYSCDVTPEDPMAASAWTGRWIGSPDGGEVSSTSGADYADLTGWENATVEANDSRISGQWQQVLTNRVFPGDIGVKSAIVRIDNDEGAWVGTFHGFAGRNSANKEWNVLEGEGGYEGLTAVFLWSGNGSTLEGVIVPGELPPLPDPIEPTAE